MSSHREAPEISKDPVADSTDLYAFVSPDDPNTVTLIANYVPLQSPDGGPNFYEFGDDVLYHINIDNNGDGKAEIIYEFRFSTVVENPNNVSLQHRTRPVADRQELEPPPGLLVESPGQERESAQHDGPGEQPGVSSVQHRATIDTELLRPGGPSRPQPPGRREGLCWSASRGLLCGPRRHLRPR